MQSNECEGVWGGKVSYGIKSCPCCGTALDIDDDLPERCLAARDTAIHARYAGLVEAAKAWAKAEPMAGVTDSRIQQELAKLEDSDDK